MGRGGLVFVLLVALFSFGDCSLPKKRYVSPVEFRTDGWISCDICLVFANLLQVGFSLNWTESHFLEEAAALCPKVMPFNEDMCSGIIQERYGPVVYKVLETVGGNAADFCHYLGLCASAPVAKFPSFNSRKLPTSSKKRNVAEKKKSQQLHRIVQMSDIHYDQYYTPGAGTDCMYSLCCRSNLNGTSPAAGRWGSYGSPSRPWGCDAPAVLVESAVNFVATKLPYAVDAVILTGDYVSHDIWANNVTEMVQETTFITSLFRGTLSQTKILPVIGNHEWFPTDQFKLPQEGSGARTEDLLNAYANLWSYIGPNETDSLRRGGFYTTPIAPGVRLVALNSQWGDMLNFWLYAGPVGGPNQTAWLLGVLQDAREAQEKVILAIHIPCNHNAGVLDDFCVELLNAVSAYDDVITLVLSGHTHQDSWVSFGPFVQYITPSITPFTAKNAAFRVFTLDSDWHPVQVDTYYFDIGAANNGNPQWKLEYTLPQAYNMPDLSVNSFDAVAKSMLTNMTVWNQFNTYHGCSTATAGWCTDALCISQEYCTLTSPTASEWGKCASSFNVTYA